MIKNKLGIITLLLSLSYMFLGLPSQIIKIWETHSVKDISILMFLLLCIQSLFWVAYGKQRKDWFVIIANSFGAIFTAIIVAEYFLLR